MEAAKTHIRVHPNPTKVSFSSVWLSRALEIKPSAVFLTPCCQKGKQKKKTCWVGLGWGSPGPSYFVLWGVCLYDTVVFRCDLRQGIRQVCLPQFAFLIRENLPAVENTDRVPGEKTCSHCAETHHTDVTQYVRRRSCRSKGLLHISSPPRRHVSESIDRAVWLLQKEPPDCCRWQCDGDGLWALASCYVTPMFVLKQHSIKVPSRKTPGLLRVWATFRHTKHFTIKKNSLL